MNDRQELWRETRRVLRLWNDELGRLIGARRATANNGEGAAPGGSRPRGGRKRLYRSRHDRMVRGVCAGLADYLGLPVTLVRAAFVVLSLPGLIHGLVLYALLAFFIPEAPWEEASL